MGKVKNAKLHTWTKKNVFSLIAVYFINLIVISALFLGAVAINNSGSGQTLKEYFNSPDNFISFAVINFFLLAILAVYFVYEDKDFLLEIKNSEMLFLIIEVAIVICFLCGKYLSPFCRPFALAAILTLFLTNSKTANIINMLFCIMVFLFDHFSNTATTLFIGNEVFFLTMGLTSGVVAIYLLKNANSRLEHVVKSLIISIPVIVCVALPVISFGSGKDIIAYLCSGLASGPLATICFFIVLPLFEAIFKRVSIFRLSELTNHNSRLIKRMIKEAPGTFNHSIVVSNIAEMCATAIGEDALLARTCAYYHDIGKLRRPEFFKENQADGVNLHDDLTPELSANIIKSHTVDGYALAVRNRLPKSIADVCREHHGTLPIWFFYDKAKKFTDGEVPLSQYCYFGPKPQSKISVIIMIADGSEAAARSITDRSRENVMTVVKKIVSDRMQLGQFDECDITLKELNIIIHTTVNSLTGVYHKRVEYPKVSLEGIDVEK